MSESIFQKRLSLLREKSQNITPDTLLIIQPENRRYLSRHFEANPNWKRGFCPRPLRADSSPDKRKVEDLFMAREQDPLAFLYVKETPNTCTQGRTVSGHVRIPGARILSAGEQRKR